MQVYRLLFVFLMFVLSATQANAAKRLGLGVVVAGPTGVTADFIYGKNRDISAALGWGQDSFHLNLDHHWNKPNIVKADGVPINIYFGVGVRWVSFLGQVGEASDSIGIRAPVGVQHIFREAPIQIFFELAPCLLLVDRTGFIIDIAIGARYFL